MPARVDLTGRTFGRLTVRTFSGSVRTGKVKRPFWECKCVCGVIVVVAAENLRSGNTTSCGCYRHEMLTRFHRIRKPNYKSEKNIWRNMIKRCEDLNDHAYKNYGRRGIFVCDSWHEFGNFIMDMGPRPSNKHSIERIDNDGPYSLDNCTWLLRSLQGRNKRSTKLETYEGRTQSVTDWAVEYKLRPATLYQRLYKYNISIEEALNLKIRRRVRKYTNRNNLVTLNGETKCLSHWIKYLELNKGTVKSRIRMGWSVTSALTVPVRYITSP